MHHACEDYTLSWATIQQRLALSLVHDIHVPVLTCVSMIQCKYKNNHPSRMLDLVTHHVHLSIDNSHVC